MKLKHSTRQHPATSPVVVVAVYYNIRFRIEPKNRTGLAHLFEHLMFEGSRNRRIRWLGMPRSVAQLAATTLPEGY